MSDAIICKSCQTANPLGSKFCNNCGERLPPATTVLCPHCRKPNPSHYLYCDHCGKRMASEKLPDAPKTDEPKPGREMFSLPARPPGMTAPIGPDHMPDWKKGGKPEPPPHSLEEIAPLQKSTGELPTWLVEDIDSSGPAFEPPKEITTDHFLELLQAAESHSKPDHAKEMAQAQIEADLPDWLQDVLPATGALSEKADSSPLFPFERPAEGAPEPATKTPPTSGSPASALPDEWLFDLETGSAEEEGSSIADWGQPKADAGLPDWLLDFAGQTQDSGSKPTAVADQEEADYSGVFKMSEFGEKVFGGTDLPDWLGEDEAAAEPDSVPVSRIFQSPEFAQEVHQALANEPPDWFFEEDVPDEEPQEQAATAVAPESPFPEDGLPDWLNELGPAYTAQFSSSPLSPEDEQGIPAWLGDLAAPATAVSQPPAQEEADEALFALDGLHEAERTLPDWLGELTPPAPQKVEADWPAEALGQADASQAILEEPFAAEQEPASSDVDWLRELSALGPEALTTEPTSLPQAPTAVSPPPSFSDEEEAFSDWLPRAAAPLAPEPAPESPDDLFDLFDESIPLGEAEEAEMPEWLTQLGLPPTDSESRAYESEEALPAEALAADDLPEWIASLRPDLHDTGGQPAGLMTAAPLLADDYSDIQEELEGALLPDWLADAAPAVPGIRPTVEPASAADVPEWLQFKKQAEPENLFGSDIGDMTAELTDLLQALPPARDPADELVKAVLPDWLQALKPKELSAEQPTPQPEQPMQEFGPLTGIRGVLEIEPVIAMPHEARPMLTPFVVNPDQQQQSTLLRQIQASLQEQARTIALTQTAVLSPLARTLITLLLLATVLLGLFGPNVQRSPVASASVTNAYAALEATAGRTVLVAFEYTPAMSAELAPQAALLLQQLKQNGSTILSVSQYAAGLEMARSSSHEEFPSLGFIPGEAIGLRELGGCLRAGLACHELAGKALNNQTRAQLADVALLIVLTGERSSLVNWIEQVGTPGNLKTVAGVTQALAPVALPYTASGQLTGVVGGLVDTAVYAQLHNAPDQTAVRQLNAQHLGQILAVLILLGGGIVTLVGQKKGS